MSKTGRAKRNFEVSDGATPAPQITTLANGVTLATVELPHMASVSVGLWVGVGGRYEAPAVNGVSHFIEHMLFKGTKKRSAKDISQAVEGIGGYLNAFTGEESTCFYARARRDHFGALLDVLGDMFLNSRFGEDDVKKERDVIKEELAMYLDQPQHRVHELLNETLWPDQPLGRPLTGTEETLDLIGRPEMLNYKLQNYVSGSTLIAVAGRIQGTEVVREASAFARRLPTGRRPVYAAAISRQEAPQTSLFTKDTEQTQLALAVRTCSRHDDRRYALRLLNAMLGENMSSRLFQVVREDRGLAYSIYSSLSFFDDAGAQVVSAGLDTGKTAAALELILAEMRKFMQKTPSVGELRRARDYVIGQFDLHMEGTENQMMWIGEQLLSYGHYTPPEEYKRRLGEVTPAMVREVAREFYRSDRLNLAVVSPMKSEEPLRRRLRI